MFLAYSERGVSDRGEMLESYFLTSLLENIDAALDAAGVIGVQAVGHRGVDPLQ